MPPRKAKTQKASKNTANSKSKRNAKNHQVNVERENTPRPRQQRGPSPDSEAGDEAAQQLLREASSANNTPTKPSPDRGLTQFLETRSASRDRAGGGKLKRPSDQHRAPKTSRNHLRPSTIEHLEKFVSSPVKPRRSDDPYDLIDSPTKKRSPDRPQPAKAKSRTGPVNGKRAAATVEAEDAPQSKRPKVNQSNTVQPQKRIIARSAKSAEETGRQPISLAKPSQLPFLASSPEESLFVNQHDQYSRPSSEAVSESDDLPQRNGHSGDDDDDDDADEEINEVPEDGPEATLRQILSSPSNPRSGRAVQQTELSSDAEQGGDSSEVEEFGQEESAAGSSGSVNAPDDSQYAATAEDPIEMSESIDDDPEEENYDALPLFGQGPLLGQIFHANKQFRSIKPCRTYYNEQGAPKQKLFPKAHNLYRYAQTLVQHLEQESRRNEELKDDFIASLDAMLRSANRLSLDLDESIELKRIYVQHVHVYVMPSLVDLLQGVVDHVCRVARSMGSQELQIPDVEAILDIIQCVASLEKRGKAWKTDLKKTELEEIDSEKKRLMKVDYKGTDYKKKRLKKIELQTAEMKKIELMMTNLRMNVVVPLQQVGRAAESQLRVLQQNREASIRHATQLRNQQERRIEERNRAVQRELANRTTARLSRLIRLRQQAERNVPLRMALHCPPLPPPGVIAQAMRDIDANGEQFERVDVFGQRYQGDAPYYEMLPGEKKWTDEERLDLMEALKEHHGPELWERTFKYFCRPNDPLRMRTASEFLRQARYMRDVFMRNDQKDGEMDVFDEWMTDIPDLDLIPFLS